MATSLRDLRRKIRSIRSTQKITSAMQLVAASKMQRAIRRAIEARPFTTLAGELVETITASIDPTNQPLFQVRDPQTILILLVTTNRGLAGPLNTQLLREFFRWQKTDAVASRDLKVVAVGTKGRAYLLRYAKDQLFADFQVPDRVPDYKDTSPIGQLLLDEFLTKRVDAVYLAYNHFHSTLRQEPRIIQYLPFTNQKSDLPASKAGIRDQKLSPSNKQLEANAPASSADLVFEPSRTEILRTLLPRHLQARLYQIFLEAHASEQSARMLAMKNATDNAGNLLDDLTLTYNGVRQSAITAELLDIAGGAAALEN